MHCDSTGGIAKTLRLPSFVLFEMIVFKEVKMLKDLRERDREREREREKERERGRERM